MPSSGRPTATRVLIDDAELEGRSDTTQLVRRTARTSALLFAAAQATSAFPPTQRASRGFYAAFLAAHAAHFVAVTRYAVRTGGHNLFPGGRSLSDVGGWPTVAGIYVAFAGLAVTGWLAQAPTVHQSWLLAAGRGANGVIAAMFAGVYLQRLLVREPAD
ncbi:MAG TPA: hypothetical protein VE617_13480 [Propionibacteriaceae bacterium]|nr:hypothetical protein [Propionibacteriaceae bacterium]